jgi:hypothetical protein
MDLSGFKSKRDKKLGDPSAASSEKDSPSSGKLKDVIKTRKKGSRDDLEDNGNNCSSSYDSQRRTGKKHRKRLTKKARRRKTGDDMSSESDSSHARKKRRKTKLQFKNEGKRSERKETSKSCSKYMGGGRAHKRQKKENCISSCTRDDAKLGEITVSRSLSSVTCNEQTGNTARINSISQSIDEKQDNMERELIQEKSLKMRPMTKEQYEIQQTMVREVYDPETNRTRLVRGSGEIIERIVPRQEHLSINQVATAGDGRSFTSAIAAVLAKSSHRAANTGNT